MSQITVLDGSGTPQTIAAVDNTGQALAADCLPVVLPSTQMAALASEATLAAQSGKLPASLGPKAGAASLSVVLANDGGSSNATSAAYEASHVIKPGPGTLWGLSGYNARASGQWIQIHDAAAVPADGAVPKVLIYVAAQSSFTLDFGARGRAFAVGIIICNSSSGPTKTIGAADCWFDAQYS